MNSPLHKRITAALLIGVILSGFAIMLRLLAPGAVSLDDQRDGAAVHFSADRGQVFAASDCVLVTWHVEGIREVYVNNIPEVGDGSREVCLESLPALRVAFQDGEEANYTLPIRFFYAEPVNWLLTIALLGSALALLIALLVPVTHTSVGRALRSAARTFSIIMFVAALMLIMLELMLRLYFGALGTEADKIAYLYTREQINQLEPYALPLPEIDYGLSPDHAEHNALGYRGAEIALPKPAGTVRIVAMGGSTTYGTSVRPDETYPYYLEQVLREDYGNPNVEVINAGVFGYTSYQTLANLTFRIVELEPDVVIIYHAGNDVLPREVNPDCYRGVNPLLGLDPRGRVAASTFTQPLSPSALYRFVTINLGFGVNPTEIGSFFTDANVACGDGQDYTPADLLAANPPIYFERNLISMIGIARVHEFNLVLASWAYEEASEEAAPEWRAAVAEHNAIIRQVAAAYDAPLIDYAPQAPQQPEYWADYVHMSAAGSRHQAELFAQALVEAGLIDALDSAAD
jgi:lysophospholipase L1-like esterase